MPLNRKATFINLTTQEVEIKAIPLELRKKYLGGRGLNMYYLFQLTKKGMDPFDEDNPLIIGAGLLTGLFYGRLNVSGKSPESGYLGDSNAGGHFGPEMKVAGYDQIVIQGEADRPVYIRIVDDVVEVRDGAHLWNLDTWQTSSAIRTECQDHTIQVASCGTAAVNGVSFGSVVYQQRESHGAHRHGKSHGGQESESCRHFRHQRCPGRPS